MYRKRVTGSADKDWFTFTAMRTHIRNIDYKPSRGGTRM